MIKDTTKPQSRHYTTVPRKTLVFSLVFDPNPRYEIARGTPSNTRGWENFVVFDRNRRLPQKLYEI